MLLFEADLQIVLFRNACQQYGYNIESAMKHFLSYTSNNALSELATFPTGKFGAILNFDFKNVFTQLLNTSALHTMERDLFGLIHTIQSEGKWIIHDRVCNRYIHNV